MTRRLVVIGNGMAATRLVQRLVERDPARFAITVVGDEPHPAYNRIQLSPLLAGEKTAAQIPLLPAEWYTRHGVCLRSGEAVDEVDIQQRQLRIAETWLPWDELVFATGSRPFIPPLPGIDRPQVMPFRTLADVERILAIPGPAVVIGGGVLGVEAAAALRRHGGEVTLLHRGSGLMAPLTDAFAADELRQQLEARGIRCVLECSIAAIDADGVRLADGRVFRAARVVLATGVQPDSRLAAQSGVLCQRGIVVDRQMASSLPGISAIGECCEIDGQTWGLVAPCLRQAEVLADRLCGAPGEGFVWQDAGTRLKVTGIELFSAGEQQAGEQDDIYTSWDPIDRHYRRLQAAGIMTMTKPVLVLVGHGMVGHHFLEQCVSRNLHQQYRIVVFGEERYPAYDRVHLSEYFAGRSAESLSLAAGDFFIEHGIELRLGEAVATIDREARLVRDAEGHEIHWDKLVLATGSYPFVPPIPGNDLAGCFVYRTLDDLDRIAAHAAAAKSGVVIGGGLLGLEAANALKQLGLETQVVEFAPNLMAVQLDNGGAAMLREKIVALGVGVHT
ncbi:MAG: FAD-dependent oxidoreductase, partial [Klebsiella pneumoniae]|nr:FAD-dependent oxidoreductase [Klebsiella pneumoniae]